MASARKSKNMNKSFCKAMEELQNRDGVYSSRRTKKRKLSDMLGFQWSKDELEHFYEAYRKHGRDWRKIAAAVRNRSPEMVEAMYNMNKGYLSLPEGHATAAGLIAKMTDHYNILEVSSKEKSDPVAPSAAACTSTTIPVEEYSEKEMNIPVDESDEYWRDNNAQIFTMRYNKKVRYVPVLPISKIPAAVLDRLIISEDKDMLEKYTEKELAQLQAHLAFSSALVSKYNSDLSSTKDNALEAKENGNRKLRQANAELEVKIKTIENELTIEKEKMKEEREAHKKEIDDLNAKMLSIVNELDGLRNEHVSQKKSAKEMEMRLEIEMTSWKSESENLLAQIAVLKKQQEDINAPPPSSTPTVEEVVAVYKESDVFLTEMLECSSHGFNLLKRVLVKDGHVEKLLVDGYSYESCIERDDEDEFL